MKPAPSSHYRAWRLYRAMSTSVVDAFCASNPLVNALLHVICAPFVLELTRLGLKMEGIIARESHLHGASAWLVDIASQRIDIAGAERIPRQGPLLLVGNHGGLGDAHAILSASPRRDTLLLAHDFGILPGLAQFRQHVIVVDETRPQTALRQSIRHLRGGGSLLLFPRGQIEADPALDIEAALDSLTEWTRSIDLFARHVPGLAIAPVAVAGLLSRRALRNPLLRCYRDRDKRHFLAATFQMMFPVYRDAEIAVRVGDALRGDSATLAAVQARMTNLLPQTRDRTRKH